jgi:hypothetical protein
MGRHYEASEWVEFFTEPGRPRVSTKRLASKFSNAVWRKFNAWADDTSGVDKDSLAYKTYASLVGHGIGLWDGDILDEEAGRSFEKVVKGDRNLVSLGHELDYAIQEDTERV